mmetsp:Transcript_15550/g.35996  ORF Transcript_15550/g.35996 Transcript_15550/m.35996 type:complete len:245 (-) Transcript_15550:511-1245(-)
MFSTSTVCCLRQRMNSKRFTQVPDGFASFQCVSCQFRSAFDTCLLFLQLRRQLGRSNQSKLEMQRRVFAPALFCLLSTISLTNIHDSHNSVCDESRVCSRSVSLREYFHYAVAAGRGDRRSCRDPWAVTCVSVGSDSSSIACLFPRRCFCGRMRSVGSTGLLFSPKFSFPYPVSPTNNRRESSSQGKIGATVVRGDSPKDGILVFSTSLKLDVGVGIAKKERSLSLSCCSLFPEKRSNTGRPGK